MRPILPGIHTIIHYFETLKEDPASLRPDVCPHCKRADPRCHGHYARKADRQSMGANSLNPVWIYRFYCRGCKRTCSVLPECIAPYRWYLWLIQQTALLLSTSGLSFRKISQQLLPSRWTISRWLNRFNEQFHLQAMHLKATFSWLGYANDFFQFWQTCLSKVQLSTVMMLLNNNGVAIP